MTCRREETQVFGQRANRKKTGGPFLTVLTLEGMNYMSGIQSPFHHTPQRPRGGIRLHSMRVYTLPGMEESCYMCIAKP